MFGNAKYLTFVPPSGCVRITKTVKVPTKAAFILGCNIYLFESKSCYPFATEQFEVNLK